MEEKPKDSNNTGYVISEINKEREDMKEKFKAGAVPLASDFEKLIDTIYDVKISLGRMINKK